LRADAPAMAYKDIGAMFGRTAQACRLAQMKLVARYKTSGYEAVFRQPHPVGLGKPGEDQEKTTGRSTAGKVRVATEERAAADSVSEEEAIRLAREEAAAADGLSAAEPPRVETEKVETTWCNAREAARLQKKARREEAAERLARETAQFRTATGLNYQREMLARYWMAVPAEGAETNEETNEVTEEEDEEVHEDLDLHVLDAADALLEAVDGARLPPTPPSAAQQQMSISRVLNPE
jgi:hypothetical protein